MTAFKNSKITRWIAIVASFVIVSLILWNTYTFFQKFKDEERLKMEILGKALKRFATSDLNADLTFESYILDNVNSIPMIITDGSGEITGWKNLKISDSKSFSKLNIKEKNYLINQLNIMKNQNVPIDVSFRNTDTDVQQIIYYRNSDLLNKLKYYPITFILILLLFTSVIFLFFRSSKIAEQNRLWTGMAKETAHQIGTPLSSLLGWIELLKTENIDENIVPEIEKDVNRLNVIAERFSKIGSIPELKKHNVVEETENTIKYLQSRASKQVKFNFTTEVKNPTVFLNTQLYGWVIENLVKNAIDAMKGKGKIDINLKETSKFIQVFVSDTGKGIPKNMSQKIFSPGFTTKKRGWGLGLSLSKRIIEDYHNGKIFVQKSELNKGTTFCIDLKKL